MKLKICGMKYPENIADVAALKPGYMGFIFYAKSSRCVKNKEIKNSINLLDKSIAKVGVFVNHPISEVIETCKTLNLNYAQLHGDETAAYIAKIKAAGIGTIKAFRIAPDFNWNQTYVYNGAADFFLFDTPTVGYGGSGQKFDWEQLNNYQNDIPFFLSGGLDVEDVYLIKKLAHPRLWGVDINSRMESAPALKNINRIQYFIDELKK